MQTLTTSGQHFTKFCQDLRHGARRLAELDLEENIGAAAEAADSRRRRWRRRLPMMALTFFYLIHHQFVKITKVVKIKMLTSDSSF